MHRDVKPHNVMIDHENKKVSVGVGRACFRILISSSYDSLIGVWQSSITRVRSTMYALQVDTSKVQNYWSTSKNTTIHWICGP